MASKSGVEDLKEYNEHFETLLRLAEAGSVDGASSACRSLISSIRCVQSSEVRGPIMSNPIFLGDGCTNGSRKKRQESLKISLH